MTRPFKPLLIATLTLCLMPVAHGKAADEGKDINWTSGGKWSDLTRYIGTYDYDALLAEKEIQSKLSDLIKDHDNVNIHDEFAVHAPVGFENDCLILRGNQVQKGDTNRTYMEICTYKGDISMAIYDRGGVQVLSEANEYQLLSDSLRQWVYLQGNGDDKPAPTLQSKPMNVQLNSQSKDAEDKSPMSP